MAIRIEALPNCGHIRCMVHIGKLANFVVYRMLEKADGYRMRYRVGPVPKAVNDNGRRENGDTDPGAQKQQQDRQEAEQ